MNEEALTPDQEPSSWHRFLRNLMLGLAGFYSGGVVGTVLAATNMGLPPEELKNSFVLLISAGAVAGAFGTALAIRSAWQRMTIRFIVGAVASAATIAASAALGWWGSLPQTELMVFCVVIWTSRLGAAVGAQVQSPWRGTLVGLGTAVVIAIAAKVLGHPDPAGVTGACLGLSAMALAWWRPPQGRFFVPACLVLLAGTLSIVALLAWVTPRYWPRVRVFEPEKVVQDYNEMLSSSRILFSPNGERLLCGHAAGAWLWDVDRGALLASFHPQSPATVLTVGFSSKDESVCVTRESSVLELWNVVTGASLGRVQLQKWVEPKWRFRQSDEEQVVLSADGRSALYAIRSEAMLRRLDFMTGAEMLFPMEAPGRLSWTSDGSRALLSFDKEVEYWSIDGKGPPARLGGPLSFGDQVRTLEMSADGQWMCASSLGDDLVVWAATTWKDVRHMRPLGGRLPAWLGDNGRRASWSANGSRLLTVQGTQFNQLVLWDRTKNRITSVHRHHRSILLDFNVWGVDLVISPDGARAATLDLAGRIRVWDLPTQ